MPDSGSATLMITANITGGDDDTCIAITNDAEVSASDQDDPNSDNNAASVTITVGEKCGDGDD